MNTAVIIWLAIGLIIAMTSLGIGLVIAIKGYRELSR